MAPKKNMASKQTTFQKSPPDNTNAMAGTRPYYGPPPNQRLMGKPAHPDQPSHIRHKPAMGDHSQKALFKPINSTPTRGAWTYRNHGAIFWCVILVFTVVCVFFFTALVVIANRLPLVKVTEDEEEGIELQEIESEEDQFDLLDELEAGEAQAVPLLLAQPDEESTGRDLF